MSNKETSRKFHFLREIATGGFGTVYLAKVTHGDGFSRVCAVKLLKPQWAQNEEIAARMRDEARLLGRLRHKNIVNVIDLTRIDGRAAVLMEYLEAVDIKVVIDGAKSSKRHVPLRVALEVCAAVASALDAAYNRPPYEGDKPLHVVHRDIKPSNIMIDASGLTKVLDFGVARAEFDEREAKTQELSFGSVDYMAPERLFFEPETPASDIYGLGASLYEMIALQKFGKSKLNAEKQEAFVAERFEDLLERHPMPTEEVEDLLHDLLYDMLSFKGADRPTAEQCVTRMRGFARSLKGQANSDEWAEGVIPQLIERAKQRTPNRVGRDTTSMVDKVLAEDTGGFGAMDDPLIDTSRMDAPILSSASSEATTVARPSEPPPGASLPDIDPTDPRWAALKQSTLEGLAGGGVDPVSNALDGDDGLTDSPPVQKGVDAPVSPLAVKTPPTPAPAPDIPPPVALPDAPLVPPPKPVQAPPPVATPPKPVAQPPRPVEVAPEAISEPAPKSGVFGKVMVALVALFLGGAAAFIAIFVVGAGAWFVAADPGAVAEVPVEIPAELPEPVENPPDAVDEAPVEETPVEEAPIEGAQFVSQAAGTRKVSVRCTGGSGSGADRVLVSGDPLGDCTITAVDGNRKRWVARVKDAKALEYQCFIDGSKECNAVGS